MNTSQMNPKEWAIKFYGSITKAVNSTELTQNAIQYHERKEYLYRLIKSKMIIHAYKKLRGSKQYTFFRSYKVFTMDYDGTTEKEYLFKMNRQKLLGELADPKSPLRHENQMSKILMKIERHSRPCRIKGVDYSSCSEASRELGITDSVLRNRLHKTTFPDWNWL